MSEIRVDTISEKTNANGVAIDSVTLKDGEVKLGDNNKVLLGDDSDFEIYHSGTASIVRAAMERNATVFGNDVNHTTGSMNETPRDCNNNGSSG